MKSLHFRRSRRWWIVVLAGGVLILSVITYGLYSAYSWHTYQQRTLSWQSSSKQTLTIALSLKSTSETERVGKIAALKTAARDIRQGQSHICDPARLTGWQLITTGARDAREVCGVYTQKLDHVAEQLDMVTAYLEDEWALKAALQPVLSLASTVDEKNWEQTATTWSGVYTVVSATTPSLAFNPTKQQAATVIGDIDTSWKELIAAHTKKDKTSFVTASAKLQASYGALASINTVNESQLKSLSDRLQQLYDQL
ncbi:MAG: hypothetical protein JWO61_165 [Candidatus Saccharibacteria bacterium]|nr:hypothetical protein [Candidatus Saccharibacteria bacterium]